jgi:hypothetical protein
VGDASHTSGFHRSAREVGRNDYSRTRDPNGSDGPFTNWNYACAGDFWHGGRSRLQNRHITVLQVLMRGGHPMICEFIGRPWDGRPVYYWARWNGRTQLRRYNGEGHDTWSHIAWYRSRAGQRANLWVVRPIPPQIPTVAQIPIVEPRRPTYIPEADTRRILNAVGRITPTHANRQKLMRLQAIMKAIWGWRVVINGTCGPDSRSGIIAVQRSLARFGVQADGVLSVYPDIALIYTGFSGTPKLAHLQYGTSLPGQVRRAQALLNLFRGNLNTDGVYGSRTVDAARRFQRSMGLPVTGTIDSDDWMVLLAAQRW